MNTFPKITDLSTIQSTSLEDFPNEIWIPIEGCVKRYSVSNYSRIKSHKFYFYQNHRNGKIFKNNAPERILVQNKNTSGYYQVALEIDRVRKIHRVHRIVSKAFIPNPNKKPQVNHINGVRSDNRLINLEWCTNGENQIHAYNVLGKKGPRLGVFNKETSKKVYQKTLTGEIINIFPSVAQAIRSIGFGTISNIACAARGKTNTAYGYVWEYY